MADDSTPSLSSTLTRLLGELLDRELASRLEQIYLAAAQAIARLSDMDLVRYEPEEVEDSPNLSLWEEMAPVIRDTLVDVNAVLAVIRDQVPAADGPQGRTAAPIHAAMQKLAAQITELGETIRTPQVMADRWRLLAEIQRFRTRFREEIGALVYESASVLGDLRATDIPGVEAELSVAIQLRATVADLCRLLDVRLEKIRDAEPEDVQWHAQQFQKELDAFGRTPAYTALRAQDKRAVLEFRGKLGKFSTQTRPNKRELMNLAEPFVQQAHTFVRVNERQLIINHDREALAQCGVLLEGVERAIRRDPLLSAKLLNDAVSRAQPLYGRAPDLDSFLRKIRKGSSALITLKGEELQSAVDEFRTHLAEMPL